MTPEEARQVGQALADAAVLLSQFARQAGPLDDRDRENCRRVIEAIDRAADLLHDSRQNPTASEAA